MPSVLGTNNLAQVAGCVTDLFEKFAGPDGTVWLKEFKAFLRKETCWNRGEKDGNEVKPPKHRRLSYAATDTNLLEALDNCETFTNKVLGIEVNLFEMFEIPTNLPWENVLLVYDPGTLSNRQAVEQALRGQSLDVYEEVYVDNYSGSQATGTPALHIIENSESPNSDTMNMTPDELSKTGKNFITLRGYTLAQGQYHCSTNRYLDLQSLTWFPKNRLPGGLVSGGRWFSSFSQVRFPWSDAGYRLSIGGARLAISVSLKP